MSASATALRRTYSMHGVRVDVLASDPVVVEAMDLRLRDFRTMDGATGSDDGIVLQFDAAPDRPCVAGATPAPPDRAGVAGATPAPPDRAGVAGATPEPDRPPAGSRPVYDTPFGSLYYSDADDLFGGTLAGVHMRCDAAGGHTLISADEFRGRKLYLATHPLATVALMELMERRARFSLHAACLAGKGGAGILLSGPSGAGKSTLTMALARAGMGFLSDDVVFLAAAETGPVRALGFADTVGFSSFAAERFPELHERLDEPPADGFPKRLSRIEDLFGHPALSACEPRAIVFPEVTADGRSELARLDRGDAFLRLVPDVMLTHPRATETHLGMIRALLGQVSCHTLRAGRDIERAAELIAQLV